MCMNNPLKIRSENIPQYGYKVYRGGFTDSQCLSTYFRKRIHFKNRFNKSESNKQTQKSITSLNSRLHYGRLSVYLNKSDAVNFSKNSKHTLSEVWKVEIKQTTKYAYMGKFSGAITYAVDQIKPIKRVY